MKKNKRIIILLICVIAVLGIIGTTLARYINDAVSLGEFDIAYYVFGTDFQNKTLTLDSMVPREEPYNYTIAISNFEEGRVTETAIEYTLKIKATTNLPLNYSLSLNGEDENQIVDTNVAQDEDGMYYMVMTTEIKNFGLDKDVHKYVLSITFPEEYKANSEYSDVIELLEIVIDSKQKI